MGGGFRPPRYYPRVPLGRRVAAFVTDFGAVSFLSLFGGGNLYIPLFIFFWLGLRVALVARNQGQSLGRWAFDTRLLDLRYGATPGLMELVKREAIAGFGSLLVLIGLVNLSPTNGFILVAPIPLLADCGLALLDAKNRQAFHDRFARTILVQTSRGYSLDLKLKKMFAQHKRRMK
jgi:uncharacterized RDD family membrane protein YckC